MELGMVMLGRLISGEFVIGTKGNKKLCKARMIFPMPPAQDVVQQHGDRIEPFPYMGMLIPVIQGIPMQIKFVPLMGPFGTRGKDPDIDERFLVLLETATKSLADSYMKEVSGLAIPTQKEVAAVSRGREQQERKSDGKGGVGGFKSPVLVKQ